jgi:type I restriction enzyme S subunit
MARKQLYPPSVDAGFPVLPACPRGWREAKYGDVFDVQTRPIKLDDDGRYKLVVARRNRGGIELRNEVQGRDVLTKTQFETHEGDFLISRRQIIHGACGVVPADLHGAVVSGEYSALRAKPDYDLDYFRHFSHSPYFQRTCFHSSHGVDVEKMIFKLDEWLIRPVQVPPIGEQRKIAAILSSVDEAIEKTQAVIDQVQVVKKGLTQELLSRGLPGRHTKFKQTEIGEIPASWDVRMIGKAGEVRLGRQRSPAHAMGDHMRAYLRVVNVFDDRIDLGNVKSMNFEPSDFETYRLVSGDVLLTEGDLASRHNVGRSAVFEGEIEDCCFQNTLIRFRPAQEIDSHFAHFAFCSLRLNGRFADIANGTTVFHLGGGRLASALMPLPPLDEQREIATTLRALDRRTDADRRHTKALLYVKQALMSVLLTGELRVTP